MNLIRPRSRVRVDGLSKTGQPSPKGLVKHRDHWDGRMDGKALPATIRHKVKVSPSEYLRIFELLAAERELKEAIAAGSAEKQRQAEHRFRTARAQFDRVDFAERTVRV